MSYRFSKEKFIKNAPSNIKKRVKYLLDDIENLKVDFSKNSHFGTLEVDLYGVTHELYPVYKEWCKETEM